MPELTVKAFAGLYFLFKERGWDNPQKYIFEQPMTADDLRKELDIPKENVEVVFINNLIRPLSTPLQDGDQLAFVPPGIPSVHRFWLGFYGAREEDSGVQQNNR